jgi:hypothetical protein
MSDIPDAFSRAGAYTALRLLRSEAELLDETLCFIANELAGIALATETAASDQLLVIGRVLEATRQRAAENGRVAAYVLAPTSRAHLAAALAELED